MSELHENTPQASSSTPPILPEEARGLYREVLTALNEHGVPYVVSGAFALREYTGICRTTKDLDLFLTPTNAMRALTVLRESGFETEVCDPVWLAKAHRGEYFVDLITGMSNATITVDDSWIERGIPAEIVDVPTHVLGPEELIASKLFVTRRERFDGADIAHVIYGTCGKLDWGRIVRLAGMHWEVLLLTLIFFRYAYPAQSNYVPFQLWRELIGKFSDAVANPELDARFRGSLLDENMFAIDMAEWGLDNVLEENRARRTHKLSSPGKQCA